MKGKKFLALLISAMLCVSMLAGCGGNNDGNAGSQGNDVVDNTQTGNEGEDPSKEAPEDTASTAELSSDPAVRITQGYYSFTYPVDGMDDMCAFFHFYEEQPVLGSIFYAGYAWNQIVFVGTYKVEEKETTYACIATRDDMTAEPKVITEGTAPYTVTFYDLEGNELAACGFDGDILYNDTTEVSGMGAENCMFYLDAQGDASPYAATYAGEVGIAIEDFVAVDEATSALSLYHNGRYMDLVNMMIEGNWTMTGAGEYTLTPDSASDTAATLTVNADGTAVYTPEGGDPVNMISTAAAGPAATLVMIGTIPVPGQDGVEADVVGLLYDDGTCTVVASAFGTDFDLDAGTWSMGEDGYTITFQFDNAGELVSGLGEAGAVLQYVVSSEVLGDIDTELVISYVSVISPVLVMTGTTPIPGQDGLEADVIGTLYDDGSCTVVASAFGQSIDLDAGTWSMGEDGYTVTCQFVNAGERVSDLADAGAVLWYVVSNEILGDIDVDLIITPVE